MSTIRMRNRVAAVACAAALVTASVPAAALAKTSSADVDDSAVTITGLLQGDTVSAYLIADADITASNVLEYTFADHLPEAYDSIDELAALTSDGTSFTQNSAMQDAAAAIAKAFADASVAAEATVTADADGKANLTLDSGYYLVRVTATSGTAKVYQNMIVDVSPVAGADGMYSAKSNQELQVKATEVTVEKGVGEGYQEKTDAYKVGDTVPFKVTTAIPNYPADSKYATFVIGDTPTAGLELDTASIKINGSSAETWLNDNSAGSITSAASGYTIAFDKAWILANPGASIVVTYSATLTSDAFSHDANDVTGNTATVKFNPNPYTDTTAEPSDKTTVQTYGFVFHKVAEKLDGAALAGAVFTLYDEQGEIVKDENGNPLTSTSTIVNVNGNDMAFVYFEDLSAGKYVAKETTVPAGYTAAPNVEVTLSEAVCTEDNPATETVTENNYLVVSNAVVDPKAPELPITGGAGTVALTGAGVILVAGSLILFLRNRKEEEK